MWRDLNDKDFRVGKKWEEILVKKKSFEQGVHLFEDEKSSSLVFIFISLEFL